MAIARAWKIVAMRYQKRKREKEERPFFLFSAFNEGHGIISKSFLILWRPLQTQYLTKHKNNFFSCQTLICEPKKNNFALKLDKYSIKSKI